MGMKLRYAVSGVAFGLVLSLPARQLPADTLALSLDQCITIALSENPTIKVADMEIERMDYSKKETLGQLLPTINFFGKTFLYDLDMLMISGFHHKTERAACYRSINTYALVSH